MQRVYDKITVMDYAKEARSAARSFCREHKIPFAEYGSAIAKQLEHDYRRFDELRANAGASA